MLSVSARAIIIEFLQYSKISFKYYFRNAVSIVFSLLLPILFISMMAAMTANSDGKIIHIATNLEEIEKKLANKEFYKVLNIGSKNISNQNIDIYITKFNSKLQLEYSLFNSKIDISKLIFDLEIEQDSINKNYQIINTDNDLTAYVFLSGIFVMASLQLAMYSTATKVLQDRQSKSDRLFLINPYSEYLMLTSEVVSRLVIIVFQASLLLLVCYMFFELPLTIKAIANFYLITIFGAFTLILFGYALGIFFSAYKNGIHYLTIVNLSCLFVGNVLFPASSFGSTKFVSDFFPTTPYVNLLSTQVFFAQDVSSVSLNIIYMSGWCLISALLIYLHGMKRRTS